MIKGKLTREEVLHIADLCALKLNEEEIEKLGSMLSETIDYIKILDELDTQKVSETYQVTGMTNIFQRDSEDNTTLTKEQALANAKEVIRGMMATKAVFER